MNFKTDLPGLMLYSNTPLPHSIPHLSTQVKAVLTHIRMPAPLKPTLSHTLSTVICIMMLS